jgi:oleate hydratase
MKLQRTELNTRGGEAFLVGGGIVSLAAAVHLIQDADVPASQIHILESSSESGGSMDGAGNPHDG